MQVVLTVIAEEQAPSLARPSHWLGVDGSDSKQWHTEHCLPQARRTLTTWPLLYRSQQWTQGLDYNRGYCSTTLLSPNKIHLLCYKLL